MYEVRVLTDMDPNLTNVLITKDWKIWRIDVSRALRLQHDLKDPNYLVQCDCQVLTKLRQLSYDQVFDATKPYLTKKEGKALIARRDKIVAYFAYGLAAFSIDSGRDSRKLRLSGRPGGGG
jgi:hypothetical protein